MFVLLLLFVFVGAQVSMVHACFVTAKRRGDEAAYSQLIASVIILLGSVAIALLLSQH